MLKKLIKYDFKWIFKNIMIYYILGIVFAGLGRIMSFLPESMIFNVIEGIFKGASLSLVLSGIINLVIRIWIRTGINMYKDESYLTHTIPVDIKYHFISKIITTLILIASSVVILLLVILLAYFGQEMVDFITQTFDVLSQGLNIPIVELVILIAVLVLVEIVCIVFTGIFGIVYGNSFNNSKLGKTFLFGFGSYFVFTFFSLLLLIIASLFNSSLYEITFCGGVITDYNIIIYLLIGCIILYFVYCILLYLATLRKLKQGINID